MIPAALASIPSPSTGELDLGPITVHMYGLMLLLAIACAVAITGVRWTRRGGDWDLVFRVAVWGVAFGIVGARAYHVITSWDEVPDEWWGVFAVWEGGLGVWGGIGLGALAGAIIVRRSGNSAARFLDAAAPGLLVAQAVGRLGNWWNQELYGEPTDLPWGLEIAPENRPAEHLDAETFHPTFLYELIYNLAIAGVLLLLDRRYRFKPPSLFALYVSLYTFGRFFEELLRIDPSHEYGPFRLNALVSIGVFVLSTAFFVWWQFLRGRRPEPPAAAADDGDSEEPRPQLTLGLRAMVVPELELDLDAFEGPFDLLLTLVLKDELELVDVDVAGIVVAFADRLAERSELDLDACGEFLVLVAALLELKARGLFPDEDAELAELDPDEAAEELARRLAEYRRMKEAAAWLAERLAAESDRFFRLGPAPLAPRPERQVAPQQAESLAAALRALALEPPTVSLEHMALRFPPVEQFLERFRALLRRRPVVDFDAEVRELSRVGQAVAFLALLELRKSGEVALEQARPFAPIRVSRARPAAAHAGRSPAPPPPVAAAGTGPFGSVPGTIPSGPAPAATTRARETTDEGTHASSREQEGEVAWNVRSA